jgi:hypothetical protein
LPSCTTIDEMTLPSTPRENVGSAAGFSSSNQAIPRTVAAIRLGPTASSL